MAKRPGDERRIGAVEPALRPILRRLHEIMSETDDGQRRLDKIVRPVSGLMVAEVCSIYIRRGDGSLELFATEGLNPAAVHTTFMKRGEGLVGRCAELRVPVNEPDAPEASGLLLPAGDGRGDLSLVPRGADPARRRGAGRTDGPEQDAARVFRGRRRGAADDGHGARRASGCRARWPKRGSTAGTAPGSNSVIKGQPISEGLALGHVVLHEPRVAVTELMADDTSARKRSASTRRWPSSRPHSTS